MKPVRVFSWKEMPMVRLALAFMPGICLGVWVENLPMEWVFTVMAFAGLGCLLLTRKKIPYRLRYAYAPFCLVFWVATGVWSGHRNVSLYADDFFADQPAKDSAFWEGEIIETSGGTYKKCVVRVTRRWSPDGYYRVVGGKLLVYPEEGMEVVKGQVVIFRAGFREIPAAKNPLTFDNRRYRFYQDIHYQAYWREGDIRVTGRRPPGAMERWRQVQLGKWRELLDDPAVFSIASAMVFGYKDEMPEEVRDTYAATGASHVLAVSGLHVGLIYLFCSFLLRRMPWRLGKVAISMIVIWGFAFLTGATPSVLRAATMFSFVLLGQQMRRPISIYNSLAGSALLLLIIHPLWLFNIGFQLSYLAVLGIVVFQPLFYNWWIPSWSWTDKIWTLITVSLAAQLATLPLTLHYFHQFPVYFWLSGLIVVPAAPFVIGLGMALIVAANWLPQWGWMPATLLEYLVEIMNGSLEWIQAIPGSVITGLYLPSISVAIFFCSLILLAWIWETGNRKYLAWLYLMWNIAAISRCVSDVRVFCRPELVIYHTRQSTLIDVFYKGRLVTFKDPDIQPEEEERVSGAFRKRHRSQQMEMVRIEGKTLLVSAGAPQIAIIAGNLPPPGPELQNNISPGAEVMVDTSNRRKVAGKWKEACGQNGWSFSYIRESGAIVRTIEPTHWPFLVQAHP